MVVLHHVVHVLIRGLRSCMNLLDYGDLLGSHTLCVSHVIFFFVARNRGSGSRCHSWDKEGTSFRFRTSSLISWRIVIRFYESYGQLRFDFIGSLFNIVEHFIGFHALHRWEFELIDWWFTNHVPRFRIFQSTLDLIQEVIFDWVLNGVVGLNTLLVPGDREIWHTC